MSWINDGHWVVTEITIYTSSQCPGSIAAYEGELSRIKDFVEANATAPGNHWAGFMLDEESDYGYTVSQLQTLNQWVEDMMAGTPGMSWYFTEDFPNGKAGDWSLSEWNAVLVLSWPAPQVYNRYMIDFVNNECSTYGRCMNDVTVNSQFPSPWNPQAG